jgi:hypothetical protein
MFSRSNKASNIHNPVLRYLQRVMACTIWGRKEVGTCRTDELFMLWAMLNNNNPVNTCFYMLDYLASIGTKPNYVADIVVGGVITFIARKFRVREEEGINQIEGNNRLNIETLISMKFIKHRPPLQYALTLNVPILFLLPNPSRTNTEVEENWLCVDNVQVHEEQNVDEGEGAHFHQEGEHHDQEDNQRWAWMRTKVERISTEQQRQGVELLGLRNDVQRGNRLSEENNEMLRRMMHHFHLQGPPYGPQ